MKRNFKGRTLSRLQGRRQKVYSLSDLRGLLPKRGKGEGVEHHAVYSILCDFAQTIAPLDLAVYRTVDGLKRAIPGHRVERILSNPSTNFPAHTWRAGAVVDFQIAGEVYFEKVPSIGGGRTYLEPIKRGTVKPDLTPEGMRYKVDGKDMPLTPDEIVHVRSPSFDGGISGGNRVEICKTALQAAGLEESYSAELLENNGIPPGFLVTAEDLDEEKKEQILDSYETRHARGKRGKIGLLTGGLGFQSTGLSPESLQLTETRTASIKAIARIFRYPLAFLDGTPTAEDKIEFLRSVRGILEAFEAAFTWSLLTDLEREQGYFVEFDASMLTRACVDLKVADLTPLIDRAILERNEVRTSVGFAPKSGFDDTTTLAVNNLRVLPTDEPDPQPEPQPNQPEARKAALSELVGRVLRRARKNFAKSSECEAREVELAREVLEPFAPILGIDLEKTVEVLRHEFNGTQHFEAIARRILEDA